ncbi:alpha/beta hydrolase family protein [Halospeciosus flavus]|uniref:S9 family peptidase n=1 Tax=Halospeciosus flavus TaxID=3032283 RepID=A0ABD5Z702_9EURY|nr:S9 family peptidase [Halospeciosus flavus]
MQTVRASDYHDIARASTPRVAPGGERVAFVRKVPKDDEEYESTVYVVPIGGGEPRQFTVAEGVDAEPRWSPDGDHLAFVSTRGEETDRPQLWVVPTDGGEAQKVTDVVGGVSDLAWGPDGRRVAFTQRSTPTEREVGHDLERDPDYERETPDPRVVDRHIYRQHEEYLDDTRSHVYVYDRETEKVERLTDGDYDFEAPEWGDVDTLYYHVKREADADDSLVFDVEAYDFHTEGTEQVLQTTGWLPQLAATTDGRLAYTRTPEEGASMRQADVEVYDRATDRTTVLTDGLDRTVSALGLQWGDDERRLYFCTPDEGSVTLWRVPGDGSADPQAVLGDRHVDGFDVGRDAVAVTASEWDHPSDVFAATPGGAEEVRLTRLNADYLDERAVREPEEFRFDSEGWDVQGWVLTPPDFDPDETYPLAVEIHGGPHAMWSTAGTMWHEFQALAAAGYVVFWCNPRGSTGYGEDFATAIERDWGEVTTTDVMNGVERVASREYVDEENTFVTGGSFGGFMTGWLVGHTDYFDGAVAQRGVYDLASFYGSTDAFKLVEGDFGTTPWEEPEFLWEQSPAAYVDQVTTPTLVMHAENDYRVPVNNGEMFYLFLRKNGVDTRLVRYPREGHELSRSGEPAHVVDRIERVVRWFDGYSDYSDVPPALERDPDAGLSGSTDDADSA